MSRNRLSSKQLLERLVAFDTTSRLSNLPLIDFVSDYLDAYGIRSRIIPDATGAKASLLARIGGRADAPGIVLSGHTDVVPAAAEGWTSDPFALKEDDGRFYGRGTTDMKGFLAASLAIVPDLLERKLAQPVFLAFSYDEEVGCLGVSGLVDALREEPVQPSLCIVGEPTGMTPVLAHKGKLAVRCHVRGIEAHSAMTHLGANAIEAAAEIVVTIVRTADKVASNGTRDAGYTPPYTTLQTSRIAGGTASNIIPGHCYFDFEIRNLPVDDAHAVLADIRSAAERDVLPRLRSRGDQAGIEWEILFSYPGLDIDPDSVAAKRVCAITGRQPAEKVSYGTEAGFFQQAGIPTVICGPGSIAQAHTVDEFLAVEQLAACDRFLRDVMGDMAKSV